VRQNVEGGLGRAYFGTTFESPPGLPGDNGTSDDNSDRNDTEGWRRLREFAYVSSGGRIVLW
jgi:hypothetical protein